MQNKNITPKQQRTGKIKISWTNMEKKSDFVTLEPSATWVHDWAPAKNFSRDANPSDQGTLPPSF